MKLSKMPKGLMKRVLVLFCLIALTITTVWAMVVKTVSFFVFQNTIDLTDILEFVKYVFGGELLLLLIKHVLEPRKTKNQKEETTHESDSSEVV